MRDSRNWSSRACRGISIPTNSRSPSAQPLTTPDLHLGRVRSTSAKREKGDLSTHSASLRTGFARGDSAAYRVGETRDTGKLRIATLPPVSNAFRSILRATRRLPLRYTPSTTSYCSSTLEGRPPCRPLIAANPFLFVPKSSENVPKNMVTGITRIPSIDFQR